MSVETKEPDDNMKIPTIEIPEPLLQILQLPSGLRTVLARGQHLTTPLVVSPTSVCDTLDISHNDISLWPKVLGATISPHLQNITTLLLSYNPLCRFNAPLRNIFPHLTGLSLRGTKIRELRELLYGVTGLKRLGFLDICETPLWDEEDSEPVRQSIISALARACKALQIVSGIRVVLAHRRREARKEIANTN